MAHEHWHAPDSLAADQFCMACDDERECTYCHAPAVTTSAVGLEGDYSEPNALGQREYIAPRAEPRCEECHEGFVRSERRTRLLAEEGWI